MLNGATQIALTKMDILFPELKGARSKDELTSEAIDFIKKVEEKTGVPVTLISTGPSAEDMIDLRDR